MVYVDNLGPPGIGKTAKISVEILVDFYLRTVKKNHSYFYVPNRRKIIINAYESMGCYNPHHGLVEINTKARL